MHVARWMMASKCLLNYSMFPMINISGFPIVYGKIPTKKYLITINHT